MSTRFISVPHEDLGGGVDALSPEDSIPAGYSEALSNFDPTPEGSLQKRTGWQQRSGYLPLRVRKVEGKPLDSSILLTLDSSISLSQARPVWVKGRTSVAPVGSSPLGLAEGSYYAAAPIVDPTFLLSAGNQTLSLLATDSLASSSNVWVLPSLQLTASTLDNEQLLTNERRVLPNGDVEVEVEGAVGGERVFVALLDVNASGQAHYSTPLTLDGTGVFTVPAAAHQLVGSTIQVKLKDGVGNEVLPGGSTSLSIETRILANGDVQVRWTNAGTAVPATLLLLSAPVLNEVQGTAGTLVGTVEVALPTTASFPLVSCYLIDPFTGIRESVWPDSVVTQSGSTTVTFQADPTLGSRFVIIWSEAVVQTNKLYLPYTGVGSWSDASPQLTVWGYSHEGLYTSTAGKAAGWVNEVDTYRVEGEEYLVAGIGGTLFKEDPTQGPTSSIELKAQVSSTAHIGPAFVSSVPADFSKRRTRGSLVTWAASDSGFVQVASHAWSPFTGLVEVVLKVPSWSGSLIDVDLDKLTIQGAAFPELNGEWPIYGLTSLSADEVVIDVGIPSVTSSDWDDLQSGAEAAILTDSIPLTALSPFLVGDSLLSQEQEAWGGIPLSVYSSGQGYVGVTGLSLPLVMGAGLVLKGTRSSSLLPISAGAAEFVGGDSLTVGTLKRKPVVQVVSPWAPIPASITSSTVTLSSPLPSTLTEGDRVVLLGLGEHSKEYTVQALLSPTSFSIDADWGAAFLSTTLFGPLIQVDEALEVEHGALVETASRWIPIEGPDGSSTRFSYFGAPYTEQNVLRSAQVNDTLFFNDGESRPLKHDGLSVYRPGLPRWQPALFISIEEGAAGIPFLSPSVDITGKHTGSNAALTMAMGNEGAFKEGDQVYLNTDSSAVYTVTSVVPDSSNNSVVLSVSPAIPAATTVSKLSQAISFSYYARLNFVDENGNLVGSAATGVGDLVVKPVGVQGVIRLRLVGLPKLDLLDYSRLEVEVYRTRRNGVAPYYRVQTKTIDYSDYQGYIDIVDKTPDESLGDLDPIHSVLKGSELGTAWSPPLRARRVSSLGNRLVLGNFSSDPYIDLVLENVGEVLTAAKLAGLKLQWNPNGDDGQGQVVTEFTTTAPINTTIGASTSSATLVTSASAHGLAAGDWVYLSLRTQGDSDLTGSGYYRVDTIGTPTTFTIQRAGPAPTSGLLGRMSKATTSGHVPVYLGADWNYQDASSVRYNNGVSSLPAESHAVRRLANALNAVARLAAPWYTASAGQGYGQGQVVLNQPQADSYTALPSLLLPNSWDPALAIYVNGVKRAPNTEVQAKQDVHSSRVLVSYPNFAEVFDNPLAVVDSQSDSAIDVNPADGQDIQAIIPFFGESTFGAALKDSILLVFKTQSIYVVNLAAKAAGQNPIQRLESQGLGCSFPNTVSSIRGGVMFANPSGIYRLGQSLEPEYIGRMAQRIWREGLLPAVTDPNTLFGHNYSSKSQFLLTTPTGALVYNSTREGSNRAAAASGGAGGSWTTYQGPLVEQSLGFATLGSSSYMATRTGRVFKRRDEQEPSDYRDGSEPVTAEATLRAMDFGDEALRKTVPYVVLSFRNPEGVSKTGTSLESSVDMKGEWTSSGPALLQGYGPKDDLSDVEGQKLVGLRYPIGPKKGVRLQLRITNALIDEGCELTKVRYYLGGLSIKGVRDSAKGSG